jgi:hypothetical protein
MLRLIDQAWFAIRNAFKGAYYGYSHAYNIGYQSGYGRGYEDAQADMQEAGDRELRTRLTAQRPQINNNEFQLGYAHAQAVALGEVN